MRDLVLGPIIVALAAYGLLHPWIGILGWTWVSIMNPHAYSWRLSSMPVAAAIAISVFLGVLITKDRRNFFLTRETVALMLFMLWMCFTLPFSFKFDLALGLWNRVMKIDLMILVAIVVLYSRKHITMLVWVLVGSIGFYGVKGGIFTILTGGGYRVRGPVDIGDPEIVVWGSPIELSKQDQIKLWRDKLLRTQLLPAFEMSEAKLDQFIATIRSMRPKMLFGYPSALTHIARHAHKRGVTMDDLGICVNFVTSERLYGDQRATISQVFGCPVANGYGGRDAGFIAHECPAGGMHITADDLVVEIINDTGEVQPPGVAGEIVVTHLSTNDFPFIRYRTGDVGVLDTKLCTCGRGLPLLKEIQGRSTDFVVAADGTMMHGLSLVYILRDMPGVQSFKVVQESLELTRVLLVADASFTRKLTQLIADGFKKRLGAAVQIEVEQVESIPPEKSGKFRYIVSHVAGATRI